MEFASVDIYENGKAIRSCRFRFVIYAALFFLPAESKNYSEHRVQDSYTENADLPQ
jgi:hypothetical protein